MSNTPATFPSTEQQREIWTSSQLGDDANLTYNESVSVVLDGPLDQAAVEAGLKDLVSRHEALRATFSPDGTAMVVKPTAEVPLETLDLSSKSEAERDAQVAALLERVVTTRFDLVQGPLARATLVKLSPSRHRLVFTAHHIVCDGWSSAVLMKDWGRLYSAHLARARPELPPADPFSSYASAATRKGPAQAEDEAYWVKRFGGEIPVLELPTDRPRPPLKTYASRREDLALSEELVARLKRAGSQARISLFTSLLSGLQALLARLSNQSDVVVGVPVAGQMADGREELVGHAVYMLPIRVQLDPQQPVRALLTEVSTQLLDAQEHLNFSISDVLNKLGVRRDPSRLPLMSVIFNFDKSLGPQSLPFQGMTGQLSINARRFETYELFINAVESGGKITLECQYNADLFDRTTIQRWLAAYERVMRGMAADLEESRGTPLGLLPLLADEELERLDAWNAGSALAVDPGALVHEMVAAQAKRDPEGVAVRFQGTSLTYRALDGRANALARRLRELGVKRGQLVGLSVERSPEMLVGLCGILKAGAGYVPLDPGYPKDRLAFM
ncbi:MAG TPA: condensation domain-containing protein, partial [Myxococcales bacterium]|nr:condensation domain-containing protein [Myxococcales bacterium]